MTTDPQPAQRDFEDITYDVVIGLVEDALGTRCTNLCRPLNSYINRVYEVQREDEGAVIAKFYRPGRWTREALLDEHELLRELAGEEIPVIAPLSLADGSTLADYQGIQVALFPKLGGRICDEPSPAQWQELGRLMARAHVVGSSHDAAHRITMSPDDSATEQLEYILDADVVEPELRGQYEDAAYGILEHIAPLFNDHEEIRIHGDCHPQNIIYRAGESFYLIDFDDMAMGPPVQDVWMLLPGRVQDSFAELDMFLEGYETFRDFDHSSLALVEPLRVMRYIHFTAWCAHQVADGGFSRLAPDWGTHGYWQQEITELEKQRVEIDDALDRPPLY